MLDATTNACMVSSRRVFLRNVVAGGLTLATGRFSNNPFGSAYADATSNKLNVLEPSPLNAEPAMNDLLASWITPAESFYVRCHGNVPELDPVKARLLVGGKVRAPLTLSLDDIKKNFAPVKVTATLQCAGNRRSEMAHAKPIKGTPWTSGAIGNAEWTGVRLRDVLELADFNDAVEHIWLKGADDCALKSDKTKFGGSIPLGKALADECIIAYEMNGQPLSREHGAPLRAVIPGYIGARSVKWLYQIDAMSEESDNHFQQNAYKVMPPEIDDSNVDWKSATALSELPINSAMSVLKADSGVVDIAGWAYPTGSHAANLTKIEFSTDGGTSWQTAEYVGDNKPFCWRLWNARVDAKPGAELLCRASDSTGATQPETTPWNFKGYLHNAWQHVAVPKA